MTPIQASLILALAVAAQDAKKTRDHDWAGFKPGTWVKYETVVKSGDSETTTTQTWTLKEVTEEHVVFTIVTQAQGGPKSTNELKESRKVAYVEKGTGEVTINGKRIACTIWVEKSEGGLTTTAWISPDVPGGLVKAIAKAKGAEGTYKVVKISEKLTVSDKEVECCVLKGTMKTSFGEATTKIWRSDSVPGKQVKTETTRLMNGKKSSSTRTVVGFEIKK